MTAKIFYWFGAIVDDSFADYKNDFKKLLKGDYNPTNLEKLSGINFNRPVYSYRINECDRLIFTSHEIHGKKCLLALDVVLNHDYQKCRFLQSGVLRNHLKKLESIDLERLCEPVEERLETIIDVTDEAPEEVRAAYYHRQFIQLSDVQEHAIQVELPAVISGAAGTGKSCVAMLLIEDYVRRHRTLEARLEKPVAYVCANKKLADAMAEHWYTLPISQEVDQQDVKFLSYQELLERCVNTEGKKMVGREAFEKWYKNYQKQSKNIKKAQKEPEDEEIASDVVYQEFRVCSMDSAEKYKNRGRKQSLVRDEKQRTWIYIAYNKYLEDLGHENFINPDFLPINVEPLYGLLVGDEAQDFSKRQLDNLMKLAGRRDVVFCIGEHQSLTDYQANLPSILEMMEAQGHYSFISLEQTYRCPPLVENVVKIMVDLKYQLTGGKSYKSESTGRKAADGASGSSSRPEGEVYYIAPNQIDSHAWLRELATTRRLAVVTLPEYIAEAIELFGTELVFTPDGIKGLEYDFVLTYHLFKHEALKAAAKKVRESTVKSQSEPDDSQRIVNRPGANSDGDICYAPFCNQLVTTVTRTKNTLVFIELYNRDTAILLDRIRLLTQKSVVASMEPVIADKAEDWAAEARMLYAAGNITQARGIFRRYLGEEKDFDTWINGEKPKEVVVPPKEQGVASGSNSSVSPSLLTLPKTKRKKKKHKQEPATDAISEFEQDASILLGNFLPIDVLNFFKKYGISSAYNTLMQRGQSLLGEILSSLQKTEIFTKCLPVLNCDEPDLWKLFYELKKLETVYANSSNDVSFLFVRAYLETSIEWLENDTLFRCIIVLVMNKSPSPDKNFVHWLLQEGQGLKVLVLLLRKNQNLLNLIPEEVWKDLMQKDEFAHLLSSEVGQFVLHYLLVSRPGVVECIHPVTWQFINKNNQVGEQFSIIAAKKGYDKLLLDFSTAGFDFNQTREFSATLAVGAVMANAPKVLEVLIAHQVDTNCISAFCVDLAYFAIRGGYDAIIDELANHAYDFEAHAGYGMYPLFYAALNGNRTIVSRLLRQGCSDENSIYHTSIRTLKEAYYGQETHLRKIDELVESKQASGTVIIKASEIAWLHGFHEVAIMISKAMSDRVATISSSSIDTSLIRSEEEQDVNALLADFSKEKLIEVFGKYSSTILYKEFAKLPERPNSLLNHMLTALEKTEIFMEVIPSLGLDADEIRNLFECLAESCLDNRDLKFNDIKRCLFIKAYLKQPFQNQDGLVCEWIDRVFYHEFHKYTNPIYATDLLVVLLSEEKGLAIFAERLRLRPLMLDIIPRNIWISALATIDRPLSSTSAGKKILALLVCEPPIFVDALGEHVWEGADIELACQAACKGQVNLLELLASKGLDFNDPSNKGLKIAQHASKSGSLQVFKTLYKHGADLNATYNDTIPAILIALKCSHLEIVKFLIEHKVVTQNTYFNISEVELRNYINPSSQQVNEKLEVFIHEQTTRSFRLPLTRLIDILGEDEMNQCLRDAVSPQVESAASTRSEKAALELLEYFSGLGVRCFILDHGVEALIRKYPSTSHRLIDVILDSERSVQLFTEEFPRIYAEMGRDKNQQFYLLLMSLVELEDLQDINHARNDKKRMLFLIGFLKLPGDWLNHKIMMSWIERCLLSAAPSPARDGFLRWLCSSQAGNVFFWNLISKKPELIDAMSDEACEQALGYFLADINTIGSNIISYLIKVKPNLVTKIPDNMREKVDKCIKNNQDLLTIQKSQAVLSVEESDAEEPRCTENRRQYSERTSIFKSAKPEKNHGDSPTGGRQNSYYQ